MFKVQADGNIDKESILSSEDAKARYEDSPDSIKLAVSMLLQPTETVFLQAVGYPIMDSGTGLVQAANKDVYPLITQVFDGLVYDEVLGIPAIVALGRFLTDCDSEVYHAIMSQVDKCGHCDNEECKIERRNKMQ